MTGNLSQDYSYHATQDAGDLSSFFEFENQQATPSLWDFGNNVQFQERKDAKCRPKLLKVL